MALFNVNLSFAVSQKSDMIVCMIETKKTKAVIYARVSTLLQEFPQAQISSCTSFCDARSFELVKDYVDYGVSGRKESRPALNELIEDARRGKFKVVVVAALDRIGRDTRHLLNLFNELAGYDVKVISLRENLDLTAPIGQAMLVIISAIAELEVNLTRDRIRNALAAKKRQAIETGNGWRTGRPPLSIETIREVHRLLASGLSYSQTAKVLSISKTSVARIVKSSKDDIVPKT